MIKFVVNFSYGVNKFLEIKYIKRSNKSENTLKLQNEKIDTCKLSYAIARVYWQIKGKLEVLI